MYSLCFLCLRLIIVSLLILNLCICVWYMSQHEITGRRDRREISELIEENARLTTKMEELALQAKECDCNTSKRKLERKRNKQLGDQNRQLKRKLRELNINFETSVRRRCRQSTSYESKSYHRTRIVRKGGKQVTRLTWNLSRPRKDTTVKNTKHFSDLVTVILYQNPASQLLECAVQTRKKFLKKMFPELRVLTPDKAQLTIGSQFNYLFFRVKSKYFLFLDSSVELAEPSSDHSAGWLLHALEKVPELDFVSGSTLKPDNHLEIPCYRLLLCNWTLSQRYEYRRSVGELMICENIASSFMGRTSSIRGLFGENNPPFDANLPVMSTTDFFLRAKQKGAIAGVLPEVIFTHSKRCQATHSSDDKQKRFQAFLPFAEKHRVFRFKDADSNVFELCTNDSPIAGEGICSEDVAHQIMLGGGHWAFEGTFAYPYMIDNLQHGMGIVAEFLESQNISYYVAGGVPLGALKFGGILPWDAGDVDFFVYIESSEKLYNLMKNFAAGRGYTVQIDAESDQVQVFCTPANVGMKMGGLMSLMVAKKPEANSAQFMKMKVNGRWIPCNKSVFQEFRQYYGINYLQHHMYKSPEVAHCLREGHNACLPDFRTLEGLQGTAGTFSEYFCDL